MAKKPESRLQRKIRAALEANFNAKFFKVWGGPFMEVGLPDLVGCIDGLFFGFEVKRDAKDSEPTQIQLDTLDEFRETGGFACVVTSPSEALAVVFAAKRISKRGGLFRVEPGGGRPILRPSDWENVDRLSRSRTARTRLRSNHRTIDQLGKYMG